MSDDVKISKPRVRVIMEQGEDLVQIDVQTDNRDAVRFDLLRAVKHWPGADTAPMLWMTVQAWSALKRSKVEPWGSLKVDDFMDQCVDVVPIDQDGAVITNADEIGPGAMVARPTMLDPEPG